MLFGITPESMFTFTGIPSGLLLHAAKNESSLTACHSGDLTPTVHGPELAVDDEFATQQSYALYKTHHGANSPLVEFAPLIYYAGEICAKTAGRTPNLILPHFSLVAK